MRTYKFAIVSALLILTIAGPLEAEQTETDIYAAVVVNPVFNLTLDNADINFGYVEPGKSVELKADTYYNVVTCNSNKGKRWYLKLSILGEIAGPTPSISPSSFEWMVFRYEGAGAAAEGWKPFGAEPQVAYQSGGPDDAGGDVTLQFKYRINLPGDALAGYYRVKVLYTMTDVA
jgi:hypothetical protein